MDRSRNKRMGFSLIEVMAATLILVVTITPIIQLFSYLAYTRTVSQRQFQAINYAQELMEILKIGVSQQPLPCGTYDAVALEWLGLECLGYAAPPAGLIPQVSIEAVDAAPGLFRVKVEVAWRVKQTRTVEFTTLVLRC